MCDVPTIAVFCSESVECFPGIASRFFFKPFYCSGDSTYYGIIIHFMFHISCISIHKFLYFVFFLLPFA